jgi:DNA primase catalytic subunit
MLKRMKRKMSSMPSWRPSTREEIQRYYREEFPEKIDQLPDWLTPSGPMEYAVAFRNRFQAIKEDADDIPPKNFVRRSTRSKNTGYRFIDSWDQLLRFFQDPAANDPMRLGTGTDGLADPETVSEQRPVSKAVYYSLNTHDRFWLLAFDIDAKDVAKQRIASKEERYTEVSDSAVKESAVHSDEPSPTVTAPSDGEEGEVHSYAYRFEDIGESLKQAFELKQWLQATVGFTEVRVFYSGQGAHIYAFDDDPYYRLTLQSRKYLTKYIQERLRIPIDEQITWDRRRVMRVPYSLHSGVSRVVTEVDTPDFDYRNDPIPGFFADGEVTDNE